MGCFSLDQVETKTGDGHHIKLMEDLGYLTDQGEWVIVPAGFWTDGASVPRALWRLLPPFGHYWRAAVIHDYLYFKGTYVRFKCDKIFLEAMRSCGVSWVTAHVIYLGVRLGGWVAYGNYRRKQRRSS